MFNQTSGLWEAVLSILFFPLLFQNGFIDFAWGAGDSFWIMTAKRVFALLPVMAIILGCWVSIACVLTVVVRQNRREFLTGMLITWWDLGKSIVYFWGGILKFMLNLAVALIELCKIIALGLLSILQEAVYTPFRLLRGASRNVLSSPVPWIAVFMTIFWCIIEAVIFTYVTTPLVVDVFSNITGEHLNINLIRIPLFLFLLFVIMGSYAVLATFVDSFKKKNVSSILGIGVIETVVLFVEVVFLYREFVDSLVPWFAQYSENFELGVVGTLAISCFVWFGIRSLSWFLFAAHGTPTILYLVQGKGIVVFNQSELRSSNLRSISPEFMERIKAEVAWMREKGEELLGLLMLPPLQVVAAGINFCTMLLISRHLFELPFKSMSAIASSKTLLRKIDDSRPVVVENNNRKSREYEHVQV
jgi:hypothetical protein